MQFRPALDSGSPLPLYRQLFDEIRRAILAGLVTRGEKLPATREMAGLLGLNRATVSSAYELLESEGLISGQVGRGSFVTGGAGGGLDWERLLDESGVMAAGPAIPTGRDMVSFATSRPGDDLFPLEAFRESCQAVLRRGDLADILQLGSPGGYEPLRRRLLEDARREGVAHPDDDLIVTNGCQQALDLLARVLVRRGDTVLVEDPVYPGLKTVFAQLGAELAGVPVGDDGLDVERARQALERGQARLLVLTSNFQNPTGATMPLAARRALVAVAGARGVPVVENDAYGDLRYEGEPLPALKRLDTTGAAVLVRSFSKVSFPGLRVGWVIARRPLIERLRQAKQNADLHTDHLAQAVLLEFLESGRLETHRAGVLRAGAERLRATLAACARYLPAGTRFTHPQGGMNLWVRLPEPLDASELLGRALREGVAYLPGRYFAVARQEPGALRLSFAGLTPQAIGRGIEILGRVFSAQVERARSSEPAPAMV
jgi:2-aminoadipate transaminase